ncbi:hypothetical protein HY750_01860 [Candidatus Kuenenbacteria bacterium]|nr:hypothetical protein [Candidatus Kuenenbacteria bacterium]
MRHFDKKTEETQRYLGVLTEDFDSKVEAITEQYLDIKETLDILVLF